MRECPACMEHYASPGSCPKCGYEPPCVDGFYAYAPELSRGGGGFDAEFFPQLAHLEAANFWFRSRNKLIIWALNKYCQGFRSLLEIGCGTGFVLSGISKAFPQAELYGSEIFTTGLQYAATRVPSAHFLQMDARAIPFYEEFDVIGAFDVLEHIREDRMVLEQIHKALKPSGLLLLSVPQHNWLWSSLDDYSYHVRRYSAYHLHEKIWRAGFQVIRSTSFVSVLLPAMLMARLFKKKMDDKNFNPTRELCISPWLNSLFTFCLDAEVAAVKQGVNWPLGGSRLVIARKQPHS